MNRTSRQRPAVGGGHHVRAHPDRPRIADGPWEPASSARWHPHEGRVVGASAEWRSATRGGIVHHSDQGSQYTFSSLCEAIAQSPVGTHSLSWSPPRSSPSTGGVFRRWPRRGVKSSNDRGFYNTPGSTPARLQVAGGLRETQPCGLSEPAAPMAELSGLLRPARLVRSLPPPVGQHETAPRGASDHPVDYFKRAEPLTALETAGSGEMSPKATATTTA